MKIGFICPRCGDRLVTMPEEPVAYTCPLTGEDVEKEEAALAMQETQGEA